MQALNSLPMYARRLSIRNYSIIAVIAIAAALAFLTFYNLETYPAPWFDEGSYLHVAKNFALHGVYADSSLDEWRYYGPAIAVGPTVLMPISFVYQLNGVSILGARLVIAVYGLLAVGSMYFLSRQVMPALASLLAAALLFTSPGVNFLYNARTVLGEVPGLFFTLAGLAVWLTIGNPGRPRLIFAGVLFGLACITKNQYALIVLPSLLAGWITDMIWYRQRKWEYFVIPGVIAGLMFASWTYIVLFALGETHDISANLATLRATSAGVFFIIDFQVIEGSLRFLTSNGVYASLLPAGLIYTVILSRNRTRTGQQWGIITLFMLIALGLYITSIGWPRYAFPALALAAVPIAMLMARLFQHFHTTAEKAVVGVLLAGLLFVGLLLPIFQDTMTIVQNDDRGVYVLADYLNETVPMDAIIETWEQELAVLTDHRYHYPPQMILAVAVQQQWNSGAPITESYDFRDEVDADYVINGPFSQFTEIYPETFLTDFTLVNTFETATGPYQVWQRKTE